MPVAAIDTSAFVTVAIAAGEKVATRSIADSRLHAEQCVPLLTQAAAELGISLAEVTDVVVGMGPGPFTGLRVGVTAGLVFADAIAANLHCVCSLDVVAKQWVDMGAPAEFLVLSDARRKEVYWAKYDATGNRLSGPEVSSPAALPNLPLAGSGAELVGLPNGPTQISAAAMASFGLSLPDVGREPLYLRRPDAEVPTKRKSTLVRKRVRRNNA